MLASAGKEIPVGDDWVFEPKYDGIRIIALLTPTAVALLTRNGHDKCRQFPEITNCLRELVKKLGRNLVLDGEIVALDETGEPARFQQLQGRMHLLDAEVVSHHSTDAPAAFVAFDVLVDGDELLLEQQWHERRRRLEGVVRAAPSSVRNILRLAEVSEGSANEILREAREHGWEGVMAKRRDCPYEPGRRVRHWQKLKIENRQEFVVGGWTEPRNTREHFGALLLGYYDDGKFVYAGHSGGGFTQAMLANVHKKLKAIEIRQSPFTTVPKTNQRAHWVAPKYVVEMKFSEWTAGGMLRQPIFLGFRDDKDARSVVREPLTATSNRASRPEASPRGRPSMPSMANIARAADHAVAATAKRAKRAPAKAKTASVAKRQAPNAKRQTSVASSVAAQLRDNPKATNLILQLDQGNKLDVTNLGKIFFPVPKITKGRLLEYYAEVSPYLLPALADRPLVLKRWPNGIKEGGEFYQQKAPDKVPPGVRVETVADEGIETQRRLIGGDLATLLYIVQLGAISTDPWMSRVQSIADADYSIVDLDPGPKATFKRVVQVARWVKEVLEEFGLHAVPKTSGASGIHIVMPLPPGASYEISVALAELVARRVNEQHPKETTVKRAVKTRPPDAVYVDYLQNIRGKTVASVYSARAEPLASVSTPIKWNELHDDLSPDDFTIENVPARLKKVGDLWGAGMKKMNHLPGIVGGGEGGDAAA
jgi:bifunctional non-homologous end joining protein LigD